MDRNWKSMFCLAMTWNLVACAGSINEPLNAANVQPQQAIDFISEYHEHWEDLDFEAVAQLHSPDFEYVFFDQVVPGDAFPEILPTIWMKGVVVYSIEESDFDVVLIEPDHAFVTLAVSDETEYENGDIARTSGMMSYLLHKDEKWKIVRIHHSGPPSTDLYGGEPLE